MSVPELLRGSRSYRRFDESHRIERQTLIDLVALTRLCPSAANRQPLKYVVAAEPDERDRVFPYLRWAGALTDWPGPAPGERPAGYILVLGDLNIIDHFHVDPGIVAQSMLLAAVEQGLGGCMVASIDRNGLRKTLRIPDRFTIELAVALGKPAETVVLDDAKDPDDVAYWRDAEGVHHVPKRPLSELLLELS